MKSKITIPIILTSILLLSFCFLPRFSYGQKQDNAQKEIAIYRKLTNPDSKNIDVSRALARAYLSNQNYDLARKEFNRMFRLMERENAKKRKIFYPASLFLVLSFWAVARKLGKNKKIKMLQRPRQRKIEGLIILTILIILLILSRLFFIPYAINNGELLYRGQIAKDLIDGLKSSIFNYQYAGYNGGILLIGFLSVPVFLLFGDTIFSFSLLPIAISAVTLILIYFFMLKFFDRNSAVLVGFLFVVGSPFSFIQRSMFAFGDHIEMLLFIFIIMYLLFKIFSNTALIDAYYGLYNNTQAKRKLYLLFMSFGVISGIALYACYSFFIALAVCFIFWLAYDKRLFLKKYFLIFLSSFIAGFSPWLGYNLTHNWQGLYLPGTGYPIKIFPIFSLLSKKPVSDILNTLSSLNLELKNFFYLSSNNILPIDIFYNILIFSFLVILVLNIKNLGRFFLLLFSSKKYPKTDLKIFKEFIILILVILYVLAYGLHPEKWPKAYYIFPLIPLLFILVGIFLFKVFELKKFYPLGPICGCFFSLLLIFYGCNNFKGIISMFEGRLPFDKIFEVKAYSLEGFETLFHMPNSLCITDYSDTAYMPNWDERLFPESWRPSNFSDWKYQIKKDYSYINKMAPEVRYPVYIICGIRIGDGMGKLPNKSLSLLIQRYIEPEYRNYIYEGIALSFTNRFFKEVKESFLNGAVEEAIPAKYRHYFYAEFGRRVGEKYRHNISKAIMLMEEFPKKYHPYLYKGLISSLRGSYLKNILQNYPGLISPPFRKYLYWQWGRDTCWEYHPFYDRLLWDKKGIEKRIENLPDIYKETFIIGMAEEFYNIFMYDLRNSTLKKIIEEAANVFNQADLKSEYYPYIYEGLGSGLSLKTYGHLKDYDIAVEKIVPQRYLDFFYRGYKIGLDLRFGEDREEIEKLIKAHIPG